MVYILSVLVLTRIESIFFIVAGMEQHCYFIIVEPFLHRVKALFASQPTPPMRSQVQNKLGGTQRGQPNPTDPRDIPPHMTAGAVSKARARKKKGRCLE